MLGMDGNFYGTTSAGEADNSIFKMTPSGTLSTLVSLDANNLAYPNASLVQGTDGNFYGTTNGGDGSEGIGRLYKVTPTGIVTTLLSFNNNNGAIPSPDLALGSDGNLYGTTKLAVLATELHSSSIQLQMSLPTSPHLRQVRSMELSPLLVNGPLVQYSDGNFYAALNSGEVFQMTPTGSITKQFTFNFTDGDLPGSLTLGRDQNFYFLGDAPFTGISSFGLYKFQPGGAVTNVVNSTIGYSDPYSPLTQGNDGNFYGTTVAGGNYTTNYGSIFVATPSGSISKLADFNGLNGENPKSALVLANDGNFYGVANGGTANDGVVYCLNAASSDQVAFTSAGAIPIVTSSYTVNGSALGLNLGYAPSPGDVLTVIRTTGNSPITGTFSNLPDGGTIAIKMIALFAITPF
jgi:uncharacterized repeat protein (TIGR03803 family)